MNQNSQVYQLMKIYCNVNLIPFTKEIKLLTKEVSKEYKIWNAKLNELRENDLVKQYLLFKSIYWNKPEEVTRPLSNWFNKQDMIITYRLHMLNNPRISMNIAIKIQAYIRNNNA